MKPREFETHKLKDQLKEWSIQIDLLAAKQETASLAAKKFALELEQVRTKYRALAQQLRERESHEDGSYMWENIGDGE
jgi:hypothetical protein